VSVAVAEGVIGERHREIEQTVRRAETIDRLGEDQQRLATETGDAETDASTDLAGQQRHVAEAIERVDRPLGPSPAVDGYDAAAADPNWRGRATAAVLSAQEALAAMPQQLAAAQEALGPWREAVGRAEQARRDADAMPDPVRQPAAERAAAQADRDVADAAKRFEGRRLAVSPPAVEQLLTRLEPFAPESDGACDVLRRGLIPALRRLDEASKAGDAAAFARAADESRQLIEAAQGELSLAQEALTARDPLIAAKWYARTAAELLAQTPPNVRSARVRQRDATAALSQAWDRTIHDAASLRMSALPTMQPLYAPAAPAGQPATTPATFRASGATTAPANVDPAQAAMAAAEAVLAPVRGWSRLRPRASQELDSANRDSDPPGFEEPLRLYFEALGKGRTDPPR
jgi:hypothetical protein